MAASFYQSNILLLSLIKQRYGLARSKGKDRGGGVPVDPLPGVDSSGVAIPSGSMEA